MRRRLKWSDLKDVKPISNWGMDKTYKLRILAGNRLWGLNFNMPYNVAYNMWAVEWNNPKFGSIRQYRICVFQLLGIRCFQLLDWVLGLENIFCTRK